MDGEIIQQEEGATQDLEAMKKNNGFAIAALVLGILGLCGWLLPICGGPVTLVGIILGVLGLKSEQRTMAIAGLVMSSLGMLATIGNALLGLFMGLQNSGGF